MRYLIGCGAIALLIVCILAATVLGVVVLSRTPSTSVAPPSNGSLPPSAGMPGSQGIGSCSSKAYNAVDNQTLTLRRNVFYTLETYNNTLSPAEHRFDAVVGDGVTTVTATAEAGVRAWECQTYNAAYQGAARTAREYKGFHRDHRVIGPDGSEVR